MPVVTPDPLITSSALLFEVGKTAIPYIVRATSHDKIIAKGEALLKDTVNELLQVDLTDNQRKHFGLSIRSLQDEVAVMESSKNELSWKDRLPWSNRTRQARNWQKKCTAVHRHAARTSLTAKNQKLYPGSRIRRLSLESRSCSSGSPSSESPPSNSCRSFSQNRGRSGSTDSDRTILASSVELLPTSSRSSSKQSITCPAPSKVRFNLLTGN